MISESGLKPNTLPQNLGQWADWLIQPMVSVSAYRQSRARLLNILLLTELGVLLFATPFTIVNRDSNRIFTSIIIFLIGLSIAFILSKIGMVVQAALTNGLASLIALGYYVVTTPGNDPKLIYLDFRSSMMLLVLAIITTGVVAGARACLGLTFISIVACSVVGIIKVPQISETIGQSGPGFYLILLSTPVAYLGLAGLLAIIFERNIFGLSERLIRRKNSLENSSSQLALKRQLSERLTAELQGLLFQLKSAFESQLFNIDQQQVAVVDVGAALEELGRVARRIDALSVQASQVSGNAVTVANREADVIRTNAAAYGRLQQHLDLINHSVEELTLEARNIDQVVSSISEVAEETNLLALNASIEAAGNREYGRRFTMVASEVQRLALRSRDAVEVVRQVAALLQGSVNNLAQTNKDSQERAIGLTQSSRGASDTVRDIVKGVERTTHLGENILGNIQGQQTAVIGIMDVMPIIAANSTEIRHATHRLLEAVEDLEEAGRELTQPLENTIEWTENDEHSAEESDQRWTEFFQGFSPPRFNWYDLWLRLTTPNEELDLSRREEQRAQLLNSICLGAFLFLLAYLPLQQIVNPRASIFFSLVVLLVGVVITYVVNSFGFYYSAIVIFFGATLLSYSIRMLLLESQFELLDYVKVGSAMLGLMIMVAVIIAGLRSVIWMTAIIMTLTIIFTFLRVERTFLDMLPLLAFPLIVMTGLGLLAAFLHRNISRLNEQLELQNQRLATDNRELILKESQEQTVSRLIGNLAIDLATSFERQEQLSVTQLHIIQDITTRMESLERGSLQLVGSTQQLSNAAEEARRYSQVGAVSIENGLIIIEEFESRVARTAALSADLETQAREIEQIFELIIDIADEIDLLALNASLEAAQAQETGKRFAAVAGEVQRLAGRARNASTTVREIVARVQQAVGLCVELTERGQSEIQLLSRAAQDTSLSIQEVVQIVSSTSNLTGQIMDAVQQQAEAIHQVLPRLRDISAVGQAFKDNILASGDSVDNLNAVATSLSSATE